MQVQGLQGWGGEAVSTQHVPRAVRQCRLTGGITVCRAGPPQGVLRLGGRLGISYGAWVWRGSD